MEGRETYMAPREQIANRKAKEVLALIRRHRTLSKADLKNRIDIPVSTLTRILDELVRDMWLIETGLGESTGGRRPILYTLNPSGAYAFGLDISRTYSLLILCDSHLNRVASRMWRMDVEMNPDRLVTIVGEAIHEMLIQTGRTPQDVLGIGVGSVGPVDRGNGMILDPLYFPAAGWHHVPICKMLKESTGCEVTLDNGANTAILGEYDTKDASELQHLLYLHAGVGIRSAMITGGQPVYGAVDMEGAIGQMIIQTDGPATMSANGNYGSWESLASLRAIEQRAISKLKLGRSSMLIEQLPSIEQLKYSDLIQAVQNGDALAKEILLESACYFGIGLANLLNILHPQKVILGGPLFTNNTIFYEETIRVANNKTSHIPRYQALFEKSRLGDEAVATGAAALLFRQWME
jgi:predicted NBD/HSP70 family sugar kinase